MESSASLVSASSWRTGAGAPEGDLGSVFFQPRRLDVLVHLLAFEHLAGELPTSSSHAPWVQLSDELAQGDNEPTMATLAAELIATPTAELRVSFASGGQLVRGATAAAAAIATGHPVIRNDDGDNQAIDRSVDAFLSSGWPMARVQLLLLEWARRSTRAGVVLVDLDAAGADDAIHELTCRFPLIHSEIEYLSTDDVAALEAQSHGSTHVLCVTATSPTFEKVVERHAAALRGSAVGPKASTMLESLWEKDRVVEPSQAHVQRLRRVRRRQRVDQLFARVRGR